VWFVKTVARTTLFATRPQPLLVGVLFVVALAIGLRGITSLPPDEHEILVLRTAHEMQARGDWIVPYFNDQPRLKKPPLSYWLTAFTAFASGADGQVVAWHGRVPSLLAGLAMTAMVLWAGRRFYADRAALYAGGLLVGSVGFFTYSHDGRPDLLYAALCTAGWLAGAVALLATAEKRARSLGVMWLALALACLTKGPHIPFMLVVAMALYCLTRRPRGSLSPRVLQPLAGIALVALVTLPWWLALHGRVDPAAVQGSQLTGRLLVPRFEHLFNGYYLYRPLQLLLPWFPLVVLAWIAAVRAQGETRAFTVLLLFYVGCVAFGLSLGGQQRFFYMLPVLPALCLLAGHGLAQLEERRPRLASRLWLGQTVVIVAVAAWLFWSQHDAGWLALALLVALLGGALAIRGLASVGLGALLTIILLTTAIVMRYADGDVLWSVARFERHGLARRVAALVDESQPLFSLGLTPVVYIQVTGRAIPELRSPMELERAMRERHLGQAYVLAAVKRSKELRPPMGVKALALMPSTANDRAALYLITLDKSTP
jgi:4-amino-4-deoxy-L-arabinose transferase-like glycosyltransferase